MLTPSVRRLLSSLGLLVISSVMFAQHGLAPQDIPHFSTVLSSPDVKDSLTNVDLELCHQETARVMKLAELRRPHILIVQLSPKEATRLGLTQTTLMSQVGKAGTLYEVWLVGQDVPAQLARAIEMVYETQFGTKYDDSTRWQVVKQIAGQLNERLASANSAGKELAR